MYIMVDITLSLICYLQFKVVIRCISDTIPKILLKLGMYSFILGSYSNILWDPIPVMLERSLISRRGSYAINFTLQ